MKIYSFQILLSLSAFLLFSLSSVSAAVNEVRGDRNSGYVIHVVRECDTLWEIAEEKLKDPFLWPELWKANPEIRDPNLIFPGQEIRIPEIAIPVEIPVEVPVEIPVAVPVEVPELEDRYLVSREVFLQSGYIAEDRNSIVGRILGSPERRTLMGQGDYLHIDTIKPAEINDKFYIIRAPERVIHPVTNDFLGYLIMVDGIIQVVGEDNGTKRAIVLESYREITAKNMLVDFYYIELPIEPVRERRPSIDGAIVRAACNHAMVGATDIAYLDMGADDGVRIGDLFDIITSERPHVIIGEVQIIRKEGRTSVAMVRKSSKEIEAGDLFRN
ncbi:LysM peptidoglycan-binding domain-containing protein [Thermodesulfovibrionales bacterium]|nr:LysM peptidoglycan-binding domain-containing protein [Thermodesulfovibrionales bacterium]